LTADVPIVLTLFLLVDEIKSSNPPPQKPRRLLADPADLVCRLAGELEIEFGLRGAVGRTRPLAVRGRRRALRGRCELASICARCGVQTFQPSEASLDRIPNTGDLTPEEMASLRLIVRHSFMSKTVLSTAHRTRLIELGLIRSEMGGLLPTSAGRICARG
jgi:hypothetical protein